LFIIGRALPAQVPATPVRDSISAVTLHPPYAATFACFEHAAGQLPYLGDALGADCFIVRHAHGSSGRFPGFYARSGAENADWYSWAQPVLAPFDGVVDSVRVNPMTNTPGAHGRPPASAIQFRRADGVRVTYAHVQQISVRPGQRVRAGQIVARVGNNGISAMPHTHVGAWRGKEPLQIRFDLSQSARNVRLPPIFGAGAS
jgi:murein DD-endopeptidase MepM/ murein hydrolase activator NlpD